MVSFQIYGLTLGNQLALESWQVDAANGSGQMMPKGLATWEVLTSFPPRPVRGPLSNKHTSNKCSNGNREQNELLITLLCDQKSRQSGLLRRCTSRHLICWFGGILGSASRAEFPVSLSNLVGFTPRLLYSSTHHSSESFILLKTG